MIFKLRLGRWRFTFTIAPVVEVFGVNSRLTDDKHILMWDFDDKTLNQVKASLLTVQALYTLPNIYILETKPNRNYIAYCFRRCEWDEAVEIVAATKHICRNFFKWGVVRKKFTLRVGPKLGRIPRLVYTLQGFELETARIEQLNDWVKYESMAEEKFARYMSLEVTRKGVEIKRPETLKKS